MDNHKLMCGLLIEADSYFNGKDVDTQKINEDITIKSYCSNGDCKTNGDGINALAAYYIIMLLKKSIDETEYNKYDECLLMWLSDKLFKMHLESKGIKDVISYIDGTTLNQAYDKYLKQHKVILNYWDLLDMIKGLKEANLKYMAEFYKLLNNICKIIADYNDNGSESKKLSKYSKNCLNQYITLYINISECKSYLRLLNKLKGIYDDFRVYAIQENPSNNNLATNLKKLTTKNGVELEAVRSFISYNFSNQKCYPQKKNTKSKKTDKLPLQPSNQLKGRQQKTPPAHKTEIKEPKQQDSPSSQRSIVLPKTKLGGSNHQNGHGASKIDLKTSGNSEGNTGGASGDTKSPNSENRGPGSGLNDQIGPGAESGNMDGGVNGSGSSGGKSNDDTSKRVDHADTSPPGPQTSNQAAGSENKGNVRGTTQSEQKNGSDTPKGIDNGTKNTKDNPNIGENGKEGSNDVTEKQITDSKSGIPSGGTGHVNSDKGGAGLGTGDPGSETGGGQGTVQNGQGSSGGGTRDTSSVQDGQIVIDIQGGADTSQQGRSGGSGRGTGNQGASSHQGGDIGSGSNGESPGTDTEKGGSEDTDKIPLNTGDGQNDNGGSGGGSSSEQGGLDSPPVENGTQSMLEEPFNIGPFISSIALKGMEQINNALKFFNEHKEKITDAIDTINSLYNSSVSNLKNTFNNFTEFFNNFINNLSIDFKQVENPPDSGDKKFGSGGIGGNPPTDNNPSQPQKDPQKQDSPQQNSHQPSSDGSQTSQDSQPPQTPQNPLLPGSTEQTKTHQSSQDPSGNQHSDQNGQEGPQKPGVGPVIKPEHSGSEVKGNETTGIGDIYIFKEYKKIGISIIVILIPITLTILYKYLSFGRRNELKKKNNMKKVINMVGVDKTTKTVINSSDGKKQIQIIIKSYSQKKQTKKSINSVYGEKSPSLNIYQVMQADPVPFINLFFLLIFFAYKRKRDTIE
ncbi:Plasmodium variant antigen protein Cir/Yir/Bir, putative [Plasmodium chabaudi adami]|uniref:Plasmodium variant antigen protein Cir/Yir/Bir, putative n=1 Tax=Plasmodium chabaudi adami TaxID=5826 RepID=A0A1D3LA01_PLACE|nr:Plasmodium variant antigen protein Cir/Yir/Bir, putative [Plasmodium chabaudi adami]